ncbi:hypothetical protein COLO4_20767 [Corchorus olitorius]|uniref:Uncharacterized protein n=1 Tax=Corchorus olitorius TaxID=93759 RepID=A0A1R3IX45_9ROSI|nr:hypothetical protein COLO4_20767 [Corchorus olitorius]
MAFEDPIGGWRLRSGNRVRIRSELVYKTDRDGVFKIESLLVFQGPNYVGNMPGRKCSACSKEGKQLTFAAVLKLTNLKNSCNITTLITGTLLKYDYTVVYEESEDGFSEDFLFYVFFFHLFFS